MSLDEKKKEAWEKLQKEYNETVSQLGHCFAQRLSEERVKEDIDAQHEFKMKKFENEEDRLRKRLQKIFNQAKEFEPKTPITSTEEGKLNHGSAETHHTDSVPEENSTQPAAQN